MVRHAEVTESVALCTFRISKITVEERRPSIVLLFLRSNLSAADWSTHLAQRCLTVG